ncbi:hypothetical protein [Catelliglobosispora koreensis]|uniref:hypothetical protein n=1 Tax=Catelliglobosispora koreensis TaxID=129052 RepID=UPI00037486A9|nr:hypothetical protein [Catelliglobosispora koreensis]
MTDLDVLSAGLHRLLLRLAGWLPAENLTYARGWLGEGDLAKTVDAIVAWQEELGYGLSAAETSLMREVLQELGFGPGDVPIGQVTEAAAPRATFTSAGPESSLIDGAAVDYLSRQPGVTNVWRAWRNGDRRVYLAQATPETAVWDIAVGAQRYLVALGEDFPQVEIFWNMGELTEYTQNVLLLWRVEG